jgi:hypothetical protein
MLLVEAGLAMQVTPPVVLVAPPVVLVALVIIIKLTPYAQSKFS